MSKRNNYDRLDATLASVDNLITIVTKQNQRLDEQTSKIDQLSLKIDQQSLKIEQQSITIADQSATIAEQSIRIEKQNQQIAQLLSRIEVLEGENQILKHRLSTIEERLSVLDHQMSNLAPTIRDILTGDHDILLDKDYRIIRDNESKTSFSSSRDIIVNRELNTSHYPTGLRGASQEIGKSLAKFYRLVLNYSPRLITGRNMYWVETESPIIDPT